MATNEDERMFMSFIIAVMAMTVLIVIGTITVGIAHGITEAYVLAAVLAMMASFIGVTYALYPIVKRKMEK